MSSSLDPTVTVTSSSSSSTSPSSASGQASSEAPKPEAKPRRPRGFAAMDRKRVSEIASKGGKAAHAAGTAHQFTSDEARAAGHKGGVAPHVRRGRGARTSAPSPKPSAPKNPESPTT